MSKVTESSNQTILITGSSGFIGFHAAKRFLKEGYKVFGLDSENDYYDPKLKKDRREILESDNAFTFVKHDLMNQNTSDILGEINPGKLIHLAAQAGVRHSLSSPQQYIDFNITAFLNILEYAKQHDALNHILLASTSSVYGANIESPFSESHGVDHPLQFYAVSKRTNELMAHAYASLYKVPTTVLRFFTVYGPWGRPDMALFKFTKNILNGEPIDIYNNGKHRRDFTYVDDIVDGIFRATFLPHKKENRSSFTGKDPSESYSKFRVFNIGAGRPEELEDFINEIEKNLGKKAIRNYMDMQPGDVEATHADISKLRSETGYSPSTSIEKGVKEFVEWYKSYYY